MSKPEKELGGLDSDIFRKEITLACRAWVGHDDLMCNRRYSLPFVIFIFSKRSLEHIYSFHQRLTIMFHV